MSDERPARRGWLAGLARVLPDLSAWRASRDFRLLVASGSITMLGSFVTLVAVPVQIKQLTDSFVAVGLVGAVEAVPMVLCGLYGGALADAVDRRRLVVACEFGLLSCSATLLVNALLPSPMVWPLYLVAAVAAGVDSLQRPSLEALIPRYVPHAMLPGAASLSALRWQVGAIAGPAVGGVLVSAWGPATAYGVDVLSFALSALLLFRLRPAPAAEDAEPAGLASITAGLRYAARRPDLLGTYLVDVVAMLVAMPQALFPFLADRLGAPWAMGMLYSAIAVGSLLGSVTSGWTSRVHRHGMAVAVAAAGWGAGIALAGVVDNLGLVLVCLMAAGAADMISGLFRSVIWNQSIPDQLRGRLAGIELLSYMIGPMVGNARAGLTAQLFGLRTAIAGGGLACVAAVAGVTALLPSLRRYDDRTNEHVVAERERRAALAESERSSP
ncbi:putative arabinose efflux permease, MFS family [Streptoalloteichus tenebrarius]|uniref:Arabinose efflux permease, MFS family n=1 Tax=Streptoalloteichus tenebrarius (strain ATCC 17920 / DSM 40477 / JCM 4838 / CBS 697.72 / NBRC 16177 / NCIMB 11028 / NRRL B-12390 / A12253. 1 / ISP 5477) TaxID=1933 RepID=A0ABT1I2K3_STRSD|nr:MFS transporter [Streptoalloteichus tenebrarius]MCP2262011.1 putative arabinose efflux permease, MFS family [Streptoalloteichus tenebrarius]BFF02133.1 MFS transporter [Streptoalloteichus tenebrarius]